MNLGVQMVRAAKRWRTDESGATLVEFAIVFVLFLVLGFALIDFGRLAFRFVVADKAMQVAARIATVRPPACPNVPTVNSRGSSAVLPPYRFGTSCNADAGICSDPGSIACTADASNTTAAEIWALVQPALPNDATIANLRFRYDFDDNLGFLGGPYVPIVTVELQGLDFQFVHPLSGLLTLTGATPAPGLGSAIAFPSMSVSLPGEDLAHGATS